MVPKAWSTKLMSAKIVQEIPKLTKKKKIRVCDSCKFGKQHRA